MPWIERLARLGLTIIATSHHHDLFFLGLQRLVDALDALVRERLHLLLRMPQHLWKLAADETPADGSRKLRFERGRYVANYTLQRIDGVTHMVIDYDTNIESR